MANQLLVKFTHGNVEAFQHLSRRLRGLHIDDSLIAREELKELVRLLQKARVVTAQH